MSICGGDRSLRLNPLHNRKGGIVMFVVIINFPPIKEGKDAEFREWFARTNKEFANYKGHIGRRLLKPMKGGNYAAIVEHASQETFMAMHDSPAHAEAGKRVEPLFDGTRTPQFYEVIIG
jgi:heme-degrading monooxygenase HmoA